MNFLLVRQLSLAAFGVIAFAVFIFLACCDIKRRSGPPRGPDEEL